MVGIFACRLADNIFCHSVTKFVIVLFWPSSTFSSSWNRSQHISFKKVLPMPSAGALRHCQLHKVRLQPHASKCSWSRVRADRICGRGNQGRRLQTCRWLWDPCRLCQVTNQCSMCSLFSIFLRATEQAHTYLIIWVLVSHWTYICSSLFECAQNIFLCFLNPRSVKYDPVSTPSSHCIYTGPYYRGIVLNKLHIVQCVPKMMKWLQEL